jgi:hypothetical protein
VQTRGKPRNLETTPKVLNVIYNLNAIALIKPIIELKIQMNYI